MPRFLLLATLAAVCAATLSPAAPAKRPCGWSGYSYAGVESSMRAHGVAAAVGMLALPKVQSGHVGAWVGVGGAGLGPGGSDVWIQIGLSGFDDGRVELYYEVAQPGKDPRYVRILKSVRPGRSYRVAVLEVRNRPGWWRAWLNGRAVSPPLHLPGSRAGFAPVATTETWDGGRPACNRFTYRFRDVRVAAQPGGSWTPLAVQSLIQDPGYRVVGRVPANFVASAR